MKRLARSVLLLTVLLLALCLTSCGTRRHKLTVTDRNNIILNKDVICSSENNGFYRHGDVIVFKVCFFSGLSATLQIDGEVIVPVADEAFQPQTVTYIMPDHDVEVISLINGHSGLEDDGK